MKAVLVKTCKRYHERRAACKSTWVGALRRDGVSVRFVEGGYEEQSYDAFSIYTKGGDSYCDNSIKVQEAIRCYLNLHPFDYLYICDDDTFVHPNRWMKHAPTADLECLLLYPTKKRDIQRRGAEPWITGGVGWFASRKACIEYIISIVPKCSGDDVEFTRVCQLAKLSIRDRPDLFGRDKHHYGDDRFDVVSAENSLISNHHATPKRMRYLYGKLCSRSSR